MVKYLFNYPVIDWYEKELQLMGQSLGEYVASMKLDGIEQLIYDNNMILKYKELTIGVHLEYWSYWIDFWWNNQQRLDYIFESNEEKKHYYVLISQKNTLHSPYYLNAILATINFQIISVHYLVLFLLLH